MDKITRGHFFNSQKNQAKKPAFKGASIETTKDGTKQHYIYAPIAGENVELEVVKLTRNKKGNYIPLNAKGEKTLNDEGLQKKDEDGKAKLYNGLGKAKNPDSYMKLWTPQEASLLRIENPEVKIAYRFKDGQNRTILDEARTIEVEDLGEFNLAWDPDRPALKRARTLYHLMPDMVGPSLDKDGNPMPDRRNHFELFGGQINDITGRIDHIRKLGATRILATPVTKGLTSENGYWTTNPYQIDPLRGTMADFKNMQIELFKNGMGFIADGAYVNEGWQGVHVKDIMKYGKESPFAHWFTLSESFLDDPTPRLHPPFLPNDLNTEATKNLGVKILNAPVMLQYTENSDELPTIIDNPDYDKSKKLPVRIQIFDRRLATPEQQNSSEQIDKYGRGPDHVNDIRNYDSATKLITLEIDPKSIKDLKPGNELPAKNVRSFIGRDWGRQFEVIEAGPGANIDTWDGQVDNVKKKYFISRTEKNILKYNDPTKLAKMEKATCQVRDDLAQIGRFWASEDEKNKTEYIARQLKIVNWNNEGSIKGALKGLQESGKIDPHTLEFVTVEELKNITSDNTTLAADGKSYEGDYKLKVAPLPQNMLDGLMSFPIEGIEGMPEEICSLLAGPYIKNLAASRDQIGKTRYELMADPKRDHKKMDEVYQKKIVPFVRDVINSNEALKNKIPVNAKGEFTTEEGKALFRVLSSDIMKYVMVKALSDIDPNNIDNENPGYIKYDAETVKTIEKESFKHWNDKQQRTHKDEAESLIRAISAGINRISTPENKTKFATYLENRVEDLNDKSLRAAKLIFNKTEAGAEIRIDAAKDLADMKKVYESRDYVEGGADERSFDTFAENWDGVISCWQGFFNAVKEQNPKYYAIIENSNVGSVRDNDPKTSDKLDRGNYPTSDATLSKFYDVAGPTTESSYNYMFSFNNHLVLGTNEGSDSAFDFIKKKLLDGWSHGGYRETPGFLAHGSMDSVLFSHAFGDNHDMSRLLHKLSVNHDEFEGKIGEISDNRLERWAEDTGIGKNLRIINGEIPTPDGLDIDNLKKLFGPPLVMADTMMEAYEQAAKEMKLSGDLSEKIKQATDNIATGHFKGEYLTDLPEFFGRRSVRHNWDDIVAEVKHKDPKAFDGLNEKQLEELKDKVHYNFVKPGMERIKAIELFKAIMPGANTMYAGQEVAATGFESAGKNMYLYNRNRVHYEWLEGKHEKQFAVDFNEAMKKTFGLRTSPEHSSEMRDKLSPLVNGYTVLLKPPIENKNVVALYRYNKDTDVISVLNTTELKDDRVNYTPGRVEIPYIDTNRAEYNSKEIGLQGGAEDGTIYVNAFDPKDKYIVEDGKIYKKGGSEIVLEKGTPALVLLREKPFNK